ncbi:MAG: DUF4412 domain-containing protein [Leeuwenhoekiella sp.]
MKKYMTTVITMILLVFTASAEAQFFKKLQKRIEQKVENAIIEKTSQKAEESASKSLDKIFDMDFGVEGLGFGSLDDVPDSYEFDWLYTLKMTAAENKPKTEDFLMNYYFKADAAYWGMTLDGKNSETVKMVYDNNISQLVMFMDQDGQKMAMVTKMPKLNTPDIETTTEETEEEYGSDYKVTQVAGKTILGYDCDGYRIDGPDYSYTTYVTYEVPVGFQNIYENNKQIPQGFDPSWLKKGGNPGLMLEMEMVDKNKSKDSFKMVCTRLEKAPFTIEKADYKSLGQQ